MILYKAIRYVILDMCLDSFFNNIKKNLKHNIQYRLISVKDIPHGTYIKLIRIGGYETGKIFENCEIFKTNNYAGFPTGGGIFCDGIGIIGTWFFDDDAPMIEILEY